VSPRLIVVTGPIREPLHRMAGHLIGKSVVSLAVVLCALSITLFVAPDVPLRWVLVVAATVCAAICVVSIALGVASTSRCVEYARHGVARRRTARRPSATCGLSGPSSSTDPSTTSRNR